MSVGQETIKRMAMLREQGVQLNREFEDWIFNLCMDMSPEEEFESYSSETI